MSYVSQAPKNDKNSRFGEAARARLTALDSAIVNSGSGYVAQSWLNDKDVGDLGPAVQSVLNQMCAALANGAVHYTGPTVFRNDKDFGHLGPDMLARLNAMVSQIKTLRP